MRSFAVLFFLYALLLPACAPPPAAPVAQRTSQPPADLRGRWYTNRWQTYRLLDFSDSSVFVDNHIDTVFRLRYRVAGDTLVTWLGGPEYRRRILLHTPDSLVLEGVHDNPEPRRYGRVSREP